jgi:hypothetical protein
LQQRALSLLEKGHCMAKQQMSFSIALMISLVGGLLAYWIFRTHGFPASNATSVWQNMSLGWRIGVIASLITVAYGLGGLLGALGRKGN